MARVLALVESPAQLLNTIEWAHHTGEPTRIVQLSPTDPITRLQMHRVAELGVRPRPGVDGAQIEWAEVRGTPAQRVRAMTRLTRAMRDAEKVVLGDPYAGVAQLLLNAARDPELVVVDDGTAIMEYARQWAGSLPLKRWHLNDRTRATKLFGARAERWLGERSERVSVFSAMPDTGEIPRIDNTYAWVRSLWAAPQLLDSTDLMGSSLVETGVVGEDAYLKGVERLARERRVRRYLPHRKERAAKLARIQAMGIELLRPDLPMELHARRGPIGRTLLSFPSTVIYTLPLVLVGAEVTVETITVDDTWFTDETAEASRDFIRGMGGRA